MLGFGALGQFALGQGPTTSGQTSVFADAWASPFAVPVRRAVGASIALMASGLFSVPNLAPETVAEAKWHAPLSEPVRVKPGLATALQQTCFWSGFTPAVVGPEGPITPDKWFTPLSEPVRVKPGLNAGLQQAYGANIAPIITVETVTEDKWHFAWSEPVRQKPGLSAALQQATSCIDQNALTQAETVSVDRWLINLSEPVRVKPGLLAVHQRSASDWSSFTPAVAPEGPVTVDKWFIPLAEPVRVKPGLGVQSQSAATISPTALTLKETVTEDRWQQPWSEPYTTRISLKPQLSRALYGPATAVSPTALTAKETVTESRWHQPWSEPRNPLIARQIAAARIASGVVLPFNLVPAVDGWAFAWSQPVRVKVSLPVYDQSHITVSTLALGLRRPRTKCYVFV